MTSKEAIKVIKMAITEVEWSYPLDYTVAFEKAIEVLKNVESTALDSDKIITADQAFETFGFTKHENTISGIGRIEYYVNDKQGFIITFYDKTKTFDIKHFDFDEPNIDVLTLQIIYKKCRELGWY